MYKKENKVAGFVKLNFCNQQKKNMFHVLLIVANVSFMGRHVNLKSIQIFPSFSYFTIAYIDFIHNIFLIAGFL